MAKAANTSNKQIETLADLTPDPRNARKHNPRNVGMLEKSLNEVGAARSIVIDENGVVLAGNATIEAAGRAGIERVQVVDADGETIVAVRRTGLTQTQKTRLALYDNRTAELADWDADLIADLMANERAMLDGLFENNELAKITEAINLPDFEPQQEPKLLSECFIEIYCSKNNLQQFMEILKEWQQLDGITINIS